MASYGGFDVSVQDNTKELFQVLTGKPHPLKWCIVQLSREVLNEYDLDYIIR